MTLDELRAKRDELNLRIEKMERAEAEREKRCDEIEQELVDSCEQWMRENHCHSLVVREFYVEITGAFPQYNYKTSHVKADAVFTGSKRTFLDAVRACAEIIERETRG